MAFRTPADVAAEFGAHARRALIITTVKQESLAVKAHITDVEIVAGDKGRFYEYGRFPDPAGDWLIVHAITAQGNSDAALIANTAHRDFDGFQAQLFVGVAGSLKDDIPIGSVVLGDYVYNGHSAKVEDAETLARPHGLPAANELLAVSQFLIYSDEWRDLIRAPHGMELPEAAKYPCKFPPDAVVKGIVSGEEVVAAGKSTRYAWLRSRFNDCGAVEMEGWGAMNAARYQNTPAAVVRGISDMCAGKDHARDEVHQPIAAAHAAAFAFSILSFRSKSPAGNSPPTRPVAATPVSPAPAAALEERRVEFVLNFDGAREDWPVDRVDAFVEQLSKLADDEKVALVRIDAGSVRLVLSVRERDLTKFGLPRLRKVAADAGANLLGASTILEVREAEAAKKALASASANLLAWDKELPNGAWIERPERGEIEARFSLESSSTVLLGEPGSGKSALLSRVACDLLDQRANVFAVKSDFLSTALASESDLQRELDLPGPPSELILRLAALQPVFVLIDQLDALASQLDLRGGRLNLMLNLVRRIGGAPNVHVLLSARRFEFNHDVRLRVIAAEPVLLELPPWRAVEEQLGAAGADPGAWPEKARDVVRIPQALKTFVTLAGAGRREPFTTYQSMLEQLWRDRIVSAEDGEALVALLSDLAETMAEEEALWLAASRFDSRLGPLHRLEALGFVVRSDNGLSVAFSHQTVFEFVLARTFLRKAGLLSDYVLERQDSLFVRAKAWSALNYLREAEVGAYEREFRRIWAPRNLRRHLRLLLIEFLGQVARPMRFESAILEEVLKSFDLRAFGLKAIASGHAWFAEFAPTAVRDAMSGTDAEVGLALQILNQNWKTHPDGVLQLVRDMWLPVSGRDRYIWAALVGCETWSEAVEQVAVAVLGRGAITSWQVDHLASTVAVTRPDAAARLVRAKLDLLLSEAAGKPAPAEEEGAASWSDLRRWSRLDDLLDASEWDNLSALAETAPSEFLAVLWDWYVAAFEEVLSRSGSVDDDYVYPGRYVLEIRPHSSRAGSPEREKPLVGALQIAVAELAEKAPADFLAWAKAVAGLEVLAVQQLIADGFGIAAARIASEALEWLLGDVRRFQLGTSRGHRQTTMAMVAASAPHWSEQEVERVERAVLAYQPPVPSNIAEAEGQKTFANIIRATRKDLLRSLGIERLSPRSRELVVTEDRALGDRYARSIGEVGGGFIGSPMEAGSMAKAKDRDILRILREVPDDTNWDHPTHWMRGGSIQLSRAFAEFGRNDPARAVRLIEQFEPTRQERAAGYALDAMADDARNDGLVLDTPHGLACARLPSLGAEGLRCTGGREDRKQGRRRSRRDRRGSLELASPSRRSLRGPRPRSRCRIGHRRAEGRQRPLGPGRRHGAPCGELHRALGARVRAPQPWGARQGSLRRDSGRASPARAQPEGLDGALGPPRQRGGLEAGGSVRLSKQAVRTVPGNPSNTRGGRLPRLRPTLGRPDGPRALRGVARIGPRVPSARLRRTGRPCCHLQGRARMVGREGPDHRLRDGASEDRPGARCP